MKEKKRLIKFVKRSMCILNAFSWTNDYVEGRNQVLYELLDYLDELERDM